MLDQEFRDCITQNSGRESVIICNLAIGKINTNISSVKVNKSNGLQYEEVSNTSKVIYWKKKY